MRRPRWDTLYSEKNRKWITLKVHLVLGELSATSNYTNKRSVTLCRRHKKKLRNVVEGAAV